MSEPSGLLIWGQAGEFDSPDDRAVIAAIAGNRGAGLVMGARLTAGAGLAVNVEPGWFGVASCDDGTSAVVGSRFPLTVQANTGPATGSRTDYLWCDTFPDEAEFRLVVVPAADTAGRAGLRLATIVVPAGANLASQMDIRPAAADFWTWPGLDLRGGARLDATEGGLLNVTAESGMGGAAALGRANGQVGPQEGGVTWFPLGPTWTIPAGDARPNSRYRFTAYGNGAMGGGGDSAYEIGISGLPGAPDIQMPTGGGAFGGGAQFHWTAEVNIQLYPAGNLCSVHLISYVLHAGAGNTAQGTAAWRFNQRSTQNVTYSTTAPYTVGIQGRWNNANAGRHLTHYGSAFERVAGGTALARPTGGPMLAEIASERRPPRGRMIPVG